MTVTLIGSADQESTGYFAFERTRDPTAGMSPISRWIGYAYEYDDQSASTVGIPVLPNSRVLRVFHEVSEEFTGVTAMVVGDGSDPDGWIATGVITPGTAGDFVKDYDSTYGSKGKLYQDGDTLDIGFTGVASAGSGILWHEVISYAEAVAAE